MLLNIRQHANGNFITSMNVSVVAIWADIRASFWVRGETAETLLKDFFSLANAVDCSSWLLCYYGNREIRGWDGKWAEQKDRDTFVVMSLMALSPNHSIPII